MKPRNRPHKTKRNTFDEEKRDQRIGTIIVVTALIAVILGSGFVINYLLSRPSATQPVSSTSELKAVIVDHLSVTSPNETFAKTATNTLKQAGYTVDYYPGENVTVEFYRNLPTHDYKLIILRVHSALGYNRTPPLDLFTAESYSATKYIYEQLTNQLDAAVYTNQNQSSSGTAYFGIRPEFIQYGLSGRFRDTVIILMGCDGLANSDMAQAFLSRGASACIGWNGSVTAAHTDSSTVHLLGLLLREGEPIDRGMTLTTHDVGLDPRFKSHLTYYPLTARDYVLKENKRD